MTAGAGRGELAFPLAEVGPGDGFDGLVGGRPQPRVLPDAEDADEGGVHDADAESGESGGLAGAVSASSARCRDGRRQRAAQQDEIPFDLISGLTARDGAFQDGSDFLHVVIHQASAA
jgi:hypothetical protein